MSKSNVEYFVLEEKVKCFVLEEKGSIVRQMTIFMVTINDGGADGEFVTVGELIRRMRQDWRAVPECRNKDEETLCAVERATIGTVIAWRMGWIFTLGNKN